AWNREPCPAANTGGSMPSKGLAVSSHGPPDALIAPIRVLFGSLGVTFQDTRRRGLRGRRLNPFQVDVELPVVPEIISQLHDLSDFQRQVPNPEIGRPGPLVAELVLRAY